MAALASVLTGPTGPVLTLAAASAGGDTIPADGKSALLVVNGGGSACVVTAASKTLVRPGVGQVAVTLSVPATSTAVFGPFSPADFADSTGNVDISYSEETSVTVACIRTTN